METKKYYMGCDDADPETHCDFRTEGSSVDEVYQKMIYHGKAQHSEKMNSLTPEQLQKLEKQMRQFVEKQQIAALANTPANA